jgi:amino acid transporter
MSTSQFDTSPNVLFSINKVEKSKENKDSAQTTASDMDADARILAKMGYKQELYRGFNAFMSFSFNFTAVAVISSSSLLFSYGLTTGGPAVMIWGWIIASVFTILTGLSMAEICSSYPSAGSVYHWAGMLASERGARVASYICGWFNFIGNAAGDASYAYGFSQVIAAAVALGSNGQVNFSLGALSGLAIGISFVWTLKNTARVDHQGWFNNFSAIY